MIDPSQNTKPQCLEEPAEPDTTDLLKDQSAAEIQIAFNKYQAYKEVYKIQLAKYEKQKRSLTDIISYIQETIAVQNVVYIERAEAHLYSILRALKQRLAPSDSARTYEIEQLYRKLCIGPASQNIEKWLDDWTHIYTKVIDYKIAEVQGTRPLRDFLLAIESKAPQFTETNINKLEDGKLTDMYELVKKYRKHYRFRAQLPNNSAGSHTAFATDSSNGQQQASFRGSNTKGRLQYLCGKEHYYSNCYYLNPIIRSNGWKPRKDIMNICNEKFKQESFQEAVNRFIEYRAKYNQSIKPDTSSLNKA